MAYIYRLIMRALANRIAFAIVSMVTMALVSQCSHAETIPKPQNTPRSLTVGNGFTADTVSAVYSLYVASLPSSINGNPREYSQNYLNECTATTWTQGQICGGFSIKISQSGVELGSDVRQTTFANASSVGVCPAGYEDQGAVCYRPDCPSGQVRNESGSCQVNCNDPTRDLTGQPYGGAGSLPSSVCVAGCSYPVTNGATAHKKDGTSFFEGTVGAATGDTCTGQEATNKNDTNRSPEEKCLAAGQGFITTNGTTSCVPAGTSGSPQIITKDTPKTTTTPTGTSSQQTTTSVNNGQVTTTTQTTDGNGQTTTQTQTQSQASFCQENPSSQICKAADRGIFSGSCTSGFICSSPDAATCATAMLAHQSRCQDLTENDSTGLGKSLIAGTDVQANDPRAEGNVTTINLASFDSTAGAVGAGGCITDKVFSAGGRSITLPFSQLCPYINMLGYALMAIAWITAGRIVGKA